MRKERWSVSLKLILAWSQSSPAAMRMFQLFYLHLLASLICSAAERGEATCTEGGRGRFGGGGSALREVEPTELLVRLFLECCLSCCSANTFSAISLIPMLSTMAKFSAINLYISTLKANSFLGHLRINGCVQTWLTQLSKDNSEWQISKSHWHGIHLSRATILGLPWPASLASQPIKSLVSPSQVPQSTCCWKWGREPVKVNPDWETWLGQTTNTVSKQCASQFNCLQRPMWPEKTQIPDSDAW